MKQSRESPLNTNNVSRRKDYSLLQQTATTEVAAPKPSLTLLDAVALIVGIVIRAGIFETPALVANQAGSDIAVLLFWLIGGVVSLVGALCYAELATVYPDVGGTYYYLKRGFGQEVAFLFALSLGRIGSLVHQHTDCDRYFRSNQRHNFYRSAYQFRTGTGFFAIWFYGTLATTS